MNSDQYHLAKDLFLSIVSDPPKDVRSFLQSQTNDEEVITEVVALLGTNGHNNNTEDFVAEVKGQITSSGLVFPNHRYDLIKKIGQGGMGDVYLAERKNEAVEQKVAIKILHKSDHLSEKRFLQEMRILSKLSHPNISQFIDADYLEDHRPYVVMEYAKGQRITDYCQNKKLSINARITLFIKLCHAVQHAHRHLVIHRDIKPDNVLVNNAGGLKLLDFGIAKVIEDSNFHKTQTEMGAMTPAYASPEQLFGHKIGITSDVYSLGVLLYELLTATRPYHSQHISPLAFAKILEEQEVEKPSSRLMQLSDQGKSALKTRNLNRWIRKVSGDLDKIVLKALQFDVSQRYFTVMELIDDLNRYRRRMPVLAQTPSLYYVVNKFVIRNSLIIAFFVILLGFSLFTLKQKLTLDDVSLDLHETNQQIKQERDFARRKKRTMINLTNNLLKAHYPDPLNVGKQNLIIHDRVNIATGYLYYEETLAEIHHNFALKIVYNSNYAMHTRAWPRTFMRASEYIDPLIPYALGKGWNHNYAKFLETTWMRTTKTIFAYRDDDRLIEFVKWEDDWNNRYHTSERLEIITGSQETNKYQDFKSAQPAPIMRISEKITIKNVDGTVEYYAGKKLSGIEDDHQSIDLTYSGYSQLTHVKSSLGPSIEFHYNDATDLQVIKASIGDQVWHFGYDSFDNLIQITYPDGANKLFGYQREKHLLTGIGENKPYEPQYFYQQHVSYKYDPFNRVYKVIYHDGVCAGEELTIVYHNDMTRSVTNTAGLVNHYQIEQVDGLWKVVDKDEQYAYRHCTGAQKP